MEPAPAVVRHKFDAEASASQNVPRSCPDWTGNDGSVAKADGSPVTEADRAVERLLRGTLSQARPQDSLLGEELGRVGDSDRVWVLDPIDGTGFFSRGNPNWRIHIALQVDGSTEVAVVVSPANRHQ